MNFHRIIPLLIAIFISDAGATFYKKNITDFSKCKTHSSIQERDYKVFYHFDDIVHKNTSMDDDTLTIDFHFSVLAISDAHILLSPSSTLTINDPVYEIVLGAGGNTFCDIRRKQKSNVQSSIRIRNILSAINIRSFWIHVYKNGVIDVGRDGEEIGFMSWKDPDLLPIEVFSFSTWGNVEAKWFFDCPREGNVQNSTQIEPELTHLEKLRKHLLSNYNPFVRPVYKHTEKTIISLKILANVLTLDETQSTLSVQGRASLLWEDEKLKWIPEKYDGIDSLHLYHGEIWKPDMIIENAVELNYIDPFESTMLVASNDGFITWETAFHTQTFCEELRFNRWPSDEHLCTINFNFWMHQRDELELKYNANDSELFGESFDNGWKVVEIITETQYDTDSVSKVPLRLKLKIKRHTSIFNNLLYAPYFVIMTMMLLSFWMSPMNYYKMFMICMQLVLTSMLLIGFATLLPPGLLRIPFLVVLYNSAMLESVGCVFIAIIVINLARNEQRYHPPHFVIHMLGLKWVEMCLLLPNTTPDEDSNECKWFDARYNSDFSAKNVQKSWLRLATFIDRIAFIFYLWMNIAMFFIPY